MDDHLVHADRKRRLVPVDDVCGAVADEDHVDPGIVHERRLQRVVGGDHREALPGSLLCEEEGDRDAVRHDRPHYIEIPRGRNA